MPQTQCTRCGYPDCKRYAEAIALDGAAINRCPPGGAAGVAALAALTGQAVVPLDVDCGLETARQRAVIDEAWCIGCTLCLDVCPVDCIVGASKHMHTVVAAQCTGCELCIPVCPVDCIVLVPASGALTGWAAWSPELAGDAKRRYVAHQQRLAGAPPEPQAAATPPSGAASALLAAALARSRAAR